MCLRADKHNFRWYVTSMGRPADGLKARQSKNMRNFRQERQMNNGGRAWKIANIFETTVAYGKNSMLHLPSASRDS